VCWTKKRHTRCVCIIILVGYDDSKIILYIMQEGAEHPGDIEVTRKIESVG